MPRFSACPVVCLALLMSWFAAAAFAQPPATCNGLPATIVAVTPGLITGTPGDDVIVGTAGDDRIFGLSGNDTICALGGNDEITGGPGTDVVFGGAGSDAFFWAPGDSSDRIEGASEADTLHMVGAVINETFELSVTGSRLRLFRNIAGVLLDMSGVERISLMPGGGSDLVVLNTPSGSGLQQITVDLAGAGGGSTPDGLADSLIVFGGTGNDNLAIAGGGAALKITGAGPPIEVRNSDGALDSLSIYGIDGDDIIDAQRLASGLVRLIIEGGPGSDAITGSQGADVLAGGEGDDTFYWLPGGGADLVGGEAGADTLQFLGSGAAETVTVSPGAADCRIAAGPDNVEVVASVEHVLVALKGGPDQITLNALSGGGALQKIAVDLRLSPAGTAGDGSADTVTVNGTQGVDTIKLSGAPGSFTITGLAPVMVVQGSESTRDTLVVNAGYEADTIDARGLPAGLIRLFLRGGQGNDTITGSSGDDWYLWSPGDGSDLIEGGMGSDTLDVAGSNIGEGIGIAANGSRLRFTRDVAGIAIDAGGIERIRFAARGGADTISLSDTAGTGLRQVDIDLAGPVSNAGDGQPDTVVLNAPAGSGVFTSFGPGTVTALWSALRVSVSGVESGADRLTLQPAASAPAVLSALDPDRRAAAGTAPR